MPKFSFVAKNTCTQVFVNNTYYNILGYNYIRYQAAIISYSLKARVMLNWLSSANIMLQSSALPLQAFVTILVLTTTYYYHVTYHTCHSRITMHV